MPDGFVVGVDAGATRTRCALVDPDGNVLGRGTGGGANPNSGEADLAAPLAEALRDALRDARHAHGVSPGEARGGVFGMAGAGAAGRQRAMDAAARAWRTCGLPGTPAVTDDLVVAFASGSQAREGALLLSGTGAGAAAIRDGALVRRADAAGWLIGDDGSGVWLASEGARAAVAALDGRGPRTSLAAAIPRALGVPEGADQIQGMIAAVYAEPPARIARLAPVVIAAATPPSETAATPSGETSAATPSGETSAATPSSWIVASTPSGETAADASSGETAEAPPAEEGDAVATKICAEAARLLLASLDAVLEVAGDGPVVLAGGVLTADGPVTDAVRTGVRIRDRIPVPAGDGAEGAATLARLALDHRATR